MGTFSKVAQVYDAVYAGKPYLAEVKELLKTIKPGMRLLDIGCGTGRHAHLLSRSCRVVGVEMSYEMAEIARSRGVEVVNTTIQTAPESMGKFDAAIAMFDVLDYILEYRSYAKAIKRINNLLKVGGLFYYEGWNKDEINSAFDSVRLKHFRYNNRNWLRTSYTTYKKGVYTVEFDYESEAKRVGFKETHKLYPRLGSRSFDLSKYGFRLTDIHADPYSVNAWYVKKENV